MRPRCRPRDAQLPEVVAQSRVARAVRHATFDTNFWKSFIHSRLAQTMGDAGCLSLYGREPARHRMLAEHLTAESRERIAGNARVVDIWKLRPGGQNHFFDCAVGCAVGASMLGVALPGMEGASPPRARRRVPLSELQRQKSGA